MTVTQMVKSRDTLKMYNLPAEVRFCKKCTMSNQRPRITFDENGVCSACFYQEFKHTKVDWEKREEEFLRLLDKHRRDDGSYDVLVPSSGGKDSAHVAHKLKYKYGMNPLTVTWSPNIYTDIGFLNHQNMIRVGGLANMLGTPDGNAYRKLAKLCFEIMGDPFQPFIFGAINFPSQMAVRFQVPLIMCGENGEVEYGGDMKNAFTPTRDHRTDHTKHYFSGIAPEDLVKYGIEQKDVLPFMAPPLEDMEKLGGEVHFFGYYEKWTPQENYYYCVEHTGFHANPERSEGTYSKYASLDDKIDGVHYYLSFIKFGIGRATSDSAHEIRDGHITREEGVELVRKFDGEFPKKHFNVFLEYCGITEEYFREVIDSWRSSHIWKKVNGEWKLRHTVGGDGVDD